MKELTYLNLQDIITLNEVILKHYPDEPTGLAKDKSLEATLNRITNHVHYNGVTGIFDIAALYAECLACQQCFNSANKRTALGSMIIFLLLNEMELNVQNDRASDMIVLLANGLVTTKELSLWLKFHCSYKPEEE
ncbi:type II toxin-antitoxin system death-on-curing family toxin [Legionella oakridgensis]|uniref:Death-on-curing family protein n=2 Tax=Legionella oakridgensis TaxID=29423 RepID=W0B9A2_9GAMM|nr:type II toxin-antitoxin system death-on-curing family toxin [Legionella oakridgensis]AHE67128.1 death-on-curing family protein [Legionella oakridgensis ATCC 33761 = DSM 21215]ETO93228.1 death-on-curing family protein [Legionella oakridgensis RV-2-2007]KTD38062.1 prophage maintenance system killer protein [Legionella oakridgensis]STY20215.1 prophage maintenance system killer protein [Legionella longbeachae]